MDMFSAVLAVCFIILPYRKCAVMRIIANIPKRVVTRPEKSESKRTTFALRLTFSFPGCVTTPKRDTLPAFRNTIKGKSKPFVRCIAFILSVIHITDSTGCFLDLLLINIHLLVGVLEYTYIVVIIS